MLSLPLLHKQNKTKQNPGEKAITVFEITATIVRNIYLAYHLIDSGKLNESQQTSGYLKSSREQVRKLGLSLSAGFSNLPLGVALSTSNCPEPII